MKFSGIGCFEELVSEMNKLFIAFESCEVRQDAGYIGHPISMRVRNETWEIEF